MNGLIIIITFIEYEKSFPFNYSYFRCACTLITLIPCPLLRTKFASLSERLVLRDLEMSMKMDLVSRLWKHGHYPVIEGLRKIGGGWVVGGRC